MMNRRLFLGALALLPLTACGSPTPSQSVAPQGVTTDTTTTSTKPAQPYIVYRTPT